VLVGERKDSQTYVRNKKKACDEVGILSFGTDLPEDATEEEVLKVGGGKGGRGGRMRGNRWARGGERRGAEFADRVGSEAVSQRDGLCMEDGVGGRLAGC
jgi:hypothetical protein